MSVHAYYREDLALAQLETALRLLFEGTDFASVITLAGAADEVFGKLLVAAGRTNALGELKSAVVAIHFKLYGELLEPSVVAQRANRAKNSLKHWDEGQDQLVKLDLQQEARDMLHRAMDNYWALKQSLTPAMERFQRECMAA